VSSETMLRPGSFPPHCGQSPAKASRDHPSIGRTIEQASRNMRQRDFMPIDTEVCRFCENEHIVRCIQQIRCPEPHSTTFMLACGRIPKALRDETADKRG